MGSRSRSCRPSARAGLSLAFIGVILAANRAARVVTSPLIGHLTDRFGGRRTLLVGLVLQILTMVLYVLGVRTGHPGIFFLLGRLVHGPGSACVFVAGQALALHAGGKTHGGRVGGLVRTAMAIGVPVGLVAGGVLSDLWGDERTFEAAGGALVVATLGAWYLVPDLGVVITRRPRLVEALRGLMDRRLAALGSLNFAASFAGSGLLLTTTVLLVHARHLGIESLPERTTASLFMGWLVIVEAASIPVFARMGDRFDAHAPIAALGVSAFIPALLVVGLGTRTTTVGFGFALLGAGVGALGPSLLALVGRMIEAERRGLAVAVVQVCADVGGTLGPLFGTALFAGKIALPYVVAAAIVALFLPGAFWLVRRGPYDAVS